MRRRNSVNSQLLVTTNFTESDGSGLEAKELRDATSRWLWERQQLGGELFTGSFATGRLQGICLSVRQIRVGRNGGGGSKGEGYLQTELNDSEVEIDD